MTMQSKRRRTDSHERKAGWRRNSVAWTSLLSNLSRQKFDITIDSISGAGAASRARTRYTFLLLLPETSSTHWPASHAHVMQPCGMPCRVSLCLAANASFRDTLQLGIMWCLINIILHVILAATTGVYRATRAWCLPCSPATASLLCFAAVHLLQPVR